MIINLYHEKSISSLKTKFIYIGENNYNYLQNSNFSNYVDLSIDFKNELNLQKNNYLNWIEKQRIKNNDSKYWWMTNIAGKNNLGNSLFLKLSRLKFIEKFLEKKNINEKFDIICENNFILNDIKNILKRKNIKYNYNLKNYIFYFFDYLNIYSKLLFSIFKYILDFNKFYILFLFYKKKQRDNPEKDVYIIHQCLDNKSFEKEKLECRYFKKLPSFLENQNKNVYLLPWLSNVTISTINVVKILRKNKCIIAYDLINYYEFFLIFKHIYLSAATLDQNLKFEDISCNHILKLNNLENLIHLFNTFSFWLYYSSLKKWSKNKKNIIFYDNFHLGPSEIIQKDILKNSINTKVKFYGYYHSLTSNDFLSYYTNPNELNSIIMPDKILCNSLLGYEQLIDHGYPENKLKYATAIRQNFFSNGNFKINKNNTHNLLIILPLNKSLSLDILFCLSDHQKFLKKLNIKIIIKFHPMYNLRSIPLKIKRFLKMVEISDLDLNDLLPNVSFYITCSSSSIVDGLLNGIIGYTFSPLGNFDWDYSDSYLKKYNLNVKIDRSNFKDKIINTISNYEFIKKDYIELQKKLKINFNLNYNEMLI